MRVGIDARYGFRRQLRGIGQYIAALLTYLPAVAEDGDEFVLYIDRAAEIDALPFQDPRFRLRRLGARNPLIWEEIALPWAAAQDRLDLLHLTSNYGPTCAPCPTVYTVHDLIEFIRPTLSSMRLSFRHRAGRAVRIRTLPGQLRRARRVITVSDASRDDLVSLLGLGEDVIRVIPHGIFPEFVPASDPSAVRRRLSDFGFPVPDRYVLALGALDPRKNGPFLIRAFARARSQLPDVYLWIVGIERPEIYSVPFAPAPEWLTVLGYVESSTFVSLLQGAAAFVYPSLYEGFGFPVIQAMACGVPVLASARSSVPEISSGAAILFDPYSEGDLAEKLALVLSGEGLRRGLVKAGLAHANRFSWPVATGRTYATYQEAVGESSIRNPITTFLQLYASPNAFRAAATKAMRLVRETGLSGLRETVRWKAAYPSLPLEVRRAGSARLSFEDRWVARGEGLTRLHAIGIIIPTKGNHSLLGACLTSLARSILRDARVEILVMNNGRPMGPPRDYPFPVRVFHETRPFNWAACNNRAVEHADCEFLLFLNDDVEALHGGWLDAMLAEAIRPQVGAVAPKLLYPNGTIQHYGIVLGPDGYYQHVYKFRGRDYPGEKGECLHPRQVTAVTGACLLTGKETFKSLGGFDERFPLNYNDVDFCLRLSEAGKQVIVTPYAELIHRETATRSFRIPRLESRSFQVKRDRL